MGGGGAESFEVAGLPVKNDGNNVSLDRESRLLTENDMRFNLASNLLRSEVQSIRAALQAGSNT
jgi:flagellar basal-body rod protein FlgB